VIYIPIVVTAEPWAWLFVQSCGLLEIPSDTATWHRGSRVHRTSRNRMWTLVHATGDCTRHTSSEGDS